MEVIAVYPNLALAEMAVSVLRGSGIEGIVLDEAAAVTGYQSAFGKFRVGVAPQDVERAREVLAEGDLATDEGE